MDPPISACIVVPTYNEVENVGALLDAIDGVRYEGLSVLFVDDSSPDETGAEIRRLGESRPWVGLVTRPGKKGIGSAYQDGFREAIRLRDPQALVEMDADLQHPPSVVIQLVNAVTAGAGVVVASRYVPGGGTRGWSLGRRVVSKGANAYARFMLGLTVRDATSGLRAYSRAAAAEVAEARLPAKGFEFQVAVLHLLKGKYRAVEVPFVFGARAAGRSKLGIGDVARFFFEVARMSFGR